MHAAAALAFFVVSAFAGALGVVRLDRRAMRSALGTVVVIGCALVYVAVISHT
jgi:hypothetical protein